MLHRARQPRLTRGGWFLRGHGERGDTNDVEAGDRQPVDLAVMSRDVVLDTGVN